MKTYTYLVDMLSNSKPHIQRTVTGSTYRAVKHFKVEVMQRIC